ncbi:MAG: D-alanine--D-serine ligase VanG [Clostridiales bacterium]|nr:D-alanine--D-serine ligase VanG [Clostridiales bacterium]
MGKKTIGVLFGGCSPEYGISLQSAYNVITHMDGEKYQPVLIGINRAGAWSCFSGAPEKIKDDTWHNPADCLKAIISPDRENHGVLVFDQYHPRTIRLDAAMPVLHGKNGEDGTVQGLLELAGIPIVGCGTLASALCLDKYKAHKIAAANGIRAARSFTIRSKADKAAYAEQAENLGYPLFVKPVKAGSSYGISRVLSKNDLCAAIKLAFIYDDEVIIEENIPGCEIGCAILGNDSLIVGEIDEIELSGGFFDYNEKYTLETSAIHVPARLSKQKAEEITGLAKSIYIALGCRVLARVDMFLTPSGEIVFNEVNTVPGLTAHSRFPHMLKAIGMTFAGIIDAAIELALED